MSRIFISLCIIALILAILSWLMIPTIIPSALLPSKTILLQLRLPRILMAILAGMALSVSGAAIQSLLRNPLAEPGIIGINSWAALGGILGLYFLPTQFLWLRPLLSIALALFALLLLFYLSGRRAAGLILILAGIASTSFAAACMALFLNLAPNPWVLGEMVEWLMGSLKRADISHILFILPPLALGLFLLFSCAKALDLLSLGNQIASSQGVSLTKLYWRVNLGIALCVGAIVAFCGNIGFIGLIIPHIIRPFAKHKPSHVMLLSAPLGVIFMLLSDGFIQLIPTRNELYIGVVMAFLGFPLFLHLLLCYKREANL